MASNPTICSCDSTFLVNGFCLACDNTKIRDRDREFTIIRNRNRKIPTQQEYLVFDGGHCRRKYQDLCEQWRCPCCNRTKYELLRWTMRFPKRPNRFEGWVVGLHTHHDHAMDVHGGMYSPHAAAIARFAPVIICEQCNAADATAKRKLGLPENFSFTPFEIRSFIFPTAHGWHIVNYKVAQDAYRKTIEAKPVPKFF